MAGQPIDISTLPVEQLGMILKQLEEELQILQRSYSQLKSARSVYSDSTEALQTIKPENKGKEIFVPVTGSMYVKGNLSNVDNVLVDIGGGYYVQKTTKGAVDYTERKGKEIEDKLAQIQKAMEAKRNSVVQVQMVFQAKLMAQ
eukprot:TRINITY_DN3744_c0_g1_i1.p1 TRINITY_DN3744_c0_g1~~TRINITY_DN3744_c0_g1_i1.p1  ORF type:complete len:144 (+),score=45.81 TRINITY_DN3744_c0_g1_i1:31-462(+)